LNGNVITQLTLDTSGKGSFIFNSYNSNDFITTYAALAQINIIAGATTAFVKIYTYDTYSFFGNVNGYNDFISDSAFKNSTSKSPVQLCNWFTSKSCALDNLTYNSTPVENMIYNACQTPGDDPNMTLNPGVIVTTMQKERSIINCPTCNDWTYVSNLLDKSALGVKTSADFQSQLTAATAAFKNHYPSPGNPTLPKNDTDDNPPGRYSYEPSNFNYLFHMSNSGSLVWVAPDNTILYDAYIQLGNEAAYSLFSYTPELNKFSTDTSGNQFFYLYWNYNGWGSEFGGP
jgi:hypothetical protein